MGIDHTLIDEIVRRILQVAQPDRGCPLSRRGGAIRGYDWLPLPAVCREILKAFLICREIEFPRTHDIHKLLQLISSADAELSASLSDADLLTPFGVKFGNAAGWSVGVR